MTNTVKRRAHWENVYNTKAEDVVSWFQESPTMSLDLIRAAGVGSNVSIGLVARDARCPTAPQPVSPRAAQGGGSWSAWLPGTFHAR